MSIHEFLKNAERLNQVLMEDVAANKITSATTASKISTANFISALKSAGYLYQSETNYFEDDAENIAIIKKLMNDELTEIEAATASNQLWIKRMNALKIPGIANINNHSLKQ